MKDTKPEKSDESRFYRSLKEDANQLAKSWTDMYLEYMGRGQILPVINLSCISFTVDTA